MKMIGYQISIITFQLILIRIFNIHRILINQMNYYNQLGVHHQATQDEIKKAYRRLAMEFHPDRSSKPESEQFKLITQAYTTLRNDKMRQRYDHKLGQHLKQQQLYQMIKSFINFDQAKPQEFEPLIEKRISKYFLFFY
ncbi:hypothetical protein pb186bvf_007287 [Paramecium bursaria]